MIDGSFSADIICMAEMILTVYIMGYIQVYFLGNFDESERFGLKEGLASFICSIIYVAVSYLGGWYHRDLRLLVIFFLYMMFCYVCVFGVYKIKRDIDTKHLNEDLKSFKDQLSKGDEKNE
jgi:hypothetical protein